MCLFTLSLASFCFLLIYSFLYVILYLVPREYDGKKFSLYLLSLMVCGGKCIESVFSLIDHVCVTFCIALWCYRSGANGGIWPVTILTGASF